MKILTATSATQGQRTSDFHWCIDGEVVTPVRTICARDQADPDHGCGCGRAFAGLNSHRATTTAMVRDLDGYDFDDLIEAVRGHREAASLLRGHDQATDELVRAEAVSIAEIAAEHDDGAVLEIRLEDISERD